MNDLIAMFELTLVDDVIKVVQESHYQLVPHQRIHESELRRYNQLT
ncbi:hypothetical protein APED_30035 [Acanthopleuribacter pedis]